MTHNTTPTIELFKEPVLIHLEAVVMVTVVRLGAGVKVSPPVQAG